MIQNIHKNLFSHRVVALFYSHLDKNVFYLLENSFKILRIGNILNEFKLYIFYMKKKCLHVILTPKIKASVGLTYALFVLQLVAWKWTGEVTVKISFFFFFEFIYLAEGYIAWILGD